MFTGNVLGDTDSRGYRCFSSEFREGIGFFPIDLGGQFFPRSLGGGIVGCSTKRVIIEMSNSFDIIVPYVMSTTNAAIFIVVILNFTELSCLFHNFWWFLVVL